MHSLADRPASSSATGQAPMARVPVLGVVLAAALALGAAAVMSGYPMGGPPIFAALVAVAGGVVWLYSPRAGYWILLVGGIATMVASGIALVQGAVPWLLVAFWGGSALLLAAILHMTAGAGRSSTVTTVAVVSLLALSALGLGQYVRATWTADDRAVLEALPRMVAAQAIAPVWVDEPEPAPEGAWSCTWMMPMTRSEALRTTRSLLVRNGWQIRRFSTLGISAVKSGEAVELVFADGRDSSGQRPGGTLFVATVHDVATVGTP